MLRFFQHVMHTVELILKHLSKLQDAQGRDIPILCVRDVEVHLLDERGQVVILKENVAISKKTWPSQVRFTNPSCALVNFLKQVGVLMQDSSH